MSSLQQKLKKLEELREKKRLIEQKNKELKIQEGNEKGLTTHNSDSEFGDAVEELQPRIQMVNYVNVLNVTGKQKAYLYDQKIGVTREAIKQIDEILQREEEVVAFDLEVVDNEKEDLEEVEQEDEDLDGENKEKVFQPTHVPREEAKKILEGKNFRKFIRRSSVDFSEALEETFELIEDLLENENPYEDRDVGTRIIRTKKGFELEEFLENHMCATLEWSPHQPDTFLAVYNLIDTSSKLKPLANGKVIIWSMNYKNEPQSILTSDNKINRAVFDPADQNRILGGLANGQVVVWDIKDKATPVMKTRPSLEAHSLPIYCLKVINDGRRDQILSISYEGRLCLWNPLNLQEPRLTQNLIFKEDIKRDDKEGRDETPIAPLNCIIVDPELLAEARVIVATYDKLIQGYIISDILAQGDHLPVDYHEGHQAPVCALSYKSNKLNQTLDGLLLSASFDFSIKLWRPKKSAECLMSFDFHDDYVTGVEWNPVSPCMFASIDCAGKICLWDLSEDVKYPVFVENGSPASSLCWHPDGMKLLVGTLGGEIQQWSAKRRFLVPKPENIAEFEAFLESKGGKE